MKSYFKTNRNLSISEIRVLKLILDEHFKTNHNVIMGQKEITFSEEVTELETE